jgi:hypothetical protein
MSNAIMNWKTCSFLSALHPSNQFGLREAPGVDGGLSIALSWGSIASAN